MNSYSGDVPLDDIATVWGVVGFVVFFAIIYLLAVATREWLLAERAERAARETDVVTLHNPDQWPAEWKAATRELPDVRVRPHDASRLDTGGHDNNSTEVTA